MGIKHFFGWYKKNFGQTITNLKLNQDFYHKGIHIDTLMIDLNGLFHSSTQKIYEYGSHKPKQRLMGLQKPKKMGGLTKQINVFKDICKNIESLLSLVSPEKKLILCVDGTAPSAKQRQQRERRFKAAKEKSEEEFKCFDSNSLTPGTKFMHNLTKFIDWYIRNNISSNPKWKNIEVIFSNEKSPGEGEHKLINYIRHHGNPNDTYCIHGLDADLIMLALGTHLPNFFILREDIYNQYNEFFILDIGKSRKELSALLDWSRNSTDTTFNPEYSINDFILLCFMVGNDFLPHVPSLEIIEGGIDQMIDVYKNTCEHYGHLTHTTNDKVFFKKSSLKVFLGTIAQYDKGILEDKLLHKDQFFTDTILENNAKFVDGSYNLNIENYRKEYYLSCFNPNTNIKNLCHEYLVGIQWVLSYYTRGVPDWKWCFKHHYAPFAHELAEHIDDFVFNVYKKTSPMTPFQQLLSVLPPKSSSLIPAPLCQLLTSSMSKIKVFCPTDFKIDLSGKRKEWEGIVILPIVDFLTIEEEYSKHINKVNKSDMSRNVIGNSYSYKYSPHISENFKSYYGDIQECHTIPSIIEL